MLLRTKIPESVRFAAADALQPDHGVGWQGPDVRFVHAPAVGGFATILNRPEADPFL
jgi:hypothetical protein